MKILYRALLVLWFFALHCCSTFSIISLSNRITELEIIVMSFLPLVFVAAFQPIFCGKMGVSAWGYYITDFVVLGVMALIVIVVSFSVSGGAFWLSLIIGGGFLLCLMVEVAIVGAVYGLLKLYQRGIAKGIIGTVALITIIAVCLHLIYINQKYYQINSEYAKEAVVGSSIEEILKRYGEPEQRFPKEEQESFSGTFFYEKGEDTYEITFENGVAVKYKIGYRD